jgi:hypothetical protein
VASPITIFWISSPCAGGWIRGRRHRAAQLARTLLSICIIAWLSDNYDLSIIAAAVAVTQMT